MHRILAILTKLLDETTRIDRESNGGDANNQLLLQCRHDDQLVRTMKVSLDAACGSPETAAFWSKYREISNRYCRVIQGVSSVSLFSKMHFDLIAPATAIPVVQITLEDCHKYCETRVRKLETRLNELLNLLTHIGVAQKVGAMDLAVLFLTFNEKLRIAMLDANESTNKVKETYSAIWMHFYKTDVGTNRSLTLAMGALLGSTFGGLLALIYPFNTLYCIAGAGVIGALLAKYYNSPKSEEKMAKLKFSQHQDKFECAARNLDRLVEQVEQESLNL